MNALYGMGHGTVDFMMGNLHDLQTMAAYMGSGDLDINLYERIEMIAAIEEAQNQRMRAIERGIMGMLEIDASDGVYQSFRSKTTLGLEVGSLAAGGYGLVKEAIGFSRLARMPSQIAKVAKLSIKSLKGGNGFFGHKGFELKNISYQPLRNKPINIRGRPYSGHALDQMQNRGVTPSVVEETMQSGIGMPNKIAGRTQFYDSVNNISVITENGKVVTVMFGRLNQ